MPFAISDNEKIYYETAGQGEVLVFIMGLGLPHNEWQNQIEHFQKSYRVIAIDNRGVGKSSKVGEFSIEQFARDVHAVLEKEEIDSCSLIGVSMGSLIVQACYHLFPQKVKSLVIAVPSFGIGAPFYVYPPAEVAQTIGASAVDSNFERAKKRLEVAYHPDYMCQEGCSAEDIIAQRKSYGLSLEIYNKQYNAILNYNCVPGLSEIKVPVLIINAEDDIASTFMASLFLRRRINNAALYVLKGAAHMCFVEKPAEFNQAINGFLEHLSSGKETDLYDQYDKSLGVEHNASITALQVAFLRAFAHAGDDFAQPTRDFLAIKMLQDNQRFFLNRITTDQQREQVESTSFTPGVYSYLYARTQFIDSVFEKALQNDFEQIVILGAGYDSRAYRFNFNEAKSTKIFEIDIATTQSEKLKTLEKAQIAVPANLKFVAVNFIKDDLKQKLIESGFKKGTKTLVIWEGVTMYLDQNSFEKTLTDVKGICGEGSELVFDYFYKDMVEGNDSYFGAKISRDAVNEIDEEYTFGIEKGEFDSYMGYLGYKIIDHLPPLEIGRRYLSDAKQERHRINYGFSCFAHLGV